MEKFLNLIRRDGKGSLEGVSLVELALIMPMLLLIIFGTIDLGWGVYTNNTLSLAAREAARVGIIKSASDPTIRAKAIAVATGLNLQDSNVLIEHTTEDGSDFVTVTINYIYQPFTPLIGTFIPGGGLPLSAKSTMYVE